MTLVDSSVWIDHLRTRDDRLVELLAAELAATHDFVIGELMCGNFRSRQQMFADLDALPRVEVASNQEALHLVERYKLFGLGLGWIDVHLLASAKLSHAEIYTHDQALASAADRIGIVGKPSENATRL